MDKPLFYCNKFIISKTKCNFLIENEKKKLKDIDKASQK